ncbi:MAG: ABC transporter permease [Clostridia bacterium]|nr:ABC transporter permease [Clostridia bacterium]
MEKRFEHNGFGKRLGSMLKVDFRRLFTSRIFYIIVGACLVMPILILVMTTMMDGMETTDPQTGEVSVIEGFDNTWQIIGTVVSESDMNAMSSMGAMDGADSGTDVAASSDAGAGMDLMSMCNINLLFFGIAVLVCLFVAEDFRSGYAKNLFTVRAKKTDYVASKTIAGFVGGALMLLCFFVGALAGGAIAGLPFDMTGFGIAELVMCMLSKLLLIAVFVPIYLAVSVAAKQKAWLSILGSMGIGMLLFMMIPMLTPLNATVMNVGLCLAGGAMFSIGLGAVSNVILKKTSLV